MKVFISWSGQRSAAVADALRYWLPKVIQALEPWMSADDIDKGTRWRSGLASELEQSSVGIICLTRENLDSTWIHFEAGALSKQQQNTYVCTLLLGLEPTDVREPLAQFQHTRTTKDDLRKLISTINNAVGDSKLSESELGETFEVWWPKLDERLTAIPPSTGGQSEPIREDREILEEILGLVRAQSTAGDFRRNKDMRQLTDYYEIDDKELKGFGDFARTRHLSHGTLAEIEAEYICAVLAATNGNKAEAARILGISRKSLYERIARFPQLIEMAMAERNEQISDEDEIKE
ncbi:MAG TPA: helix-turn-helix domain-containing protein [Pyrinomonadaceae bacterium]